MTNGSCCFVGVVIVGFNSAWNVFVMNFTKRELYVSVAVCCVIVGFNNAWNVFVMNFTK